MRGYLVALIGLVALLGTTQSAVAATVPLGTAGEQRIVHPTYGDRLAVVRNVGDIDADGLDDLATATTSGSQRRIWITYSPASLPATTTPGEPGWRGFEITGDSIGDSLVGLPDVNGDGLGEIAFHRLLDRRAFVVFGRSDGKTVNVDDLGDDGFTITGVEVWGNGGGGGNDRYGGVDDGSGVESLGDQNGDGRADLAISEQSQVVVVYTPGDPAGKTVNAADLATGATDCMWTATGWGLSPGRSVT